MKKLLLGLTLLLSINSALASSGDNWNLRFNPLGLILGMGDVNLDYKTTNNLVIGPEVLFWDFSMNDFKVKATGFGVQGRYYFDGAYEDGFYAGGSISTASIDVSATSLSGVKSSASASGTSIAAIGGYHWFWDSFNLNLGGALGTTSLKSIELKDENGKITEDYSAPSGASAGLEFKIGFTF